MVLDNELGAGFEAGEFGEGIEGKTYVWPNPEYRLFGERLGNAGIDLAGDGDDLFRPNEIGEGDIIQFPFCGPAQPDATLVED